MGRKQGFRLWQLVAVRNDLEDCWQCARVCQLEPLMVRRRPRSTLASFEFVVSLDCLDKEELHHLEGLQQVLRDKENAGPNPAPIGLSPDQQAAYPGIVAEGKMSFAYAVLLLGIAGPLFLNTIWLSMANLVNKGEDRQDYWWFVLFFDNYFMIVKGTMFTAFFYEFLPKPQRGRKRWTFLLLAVMWPLFSFLIHMLWLAMGTTTWGTMKLNFPVGASAAVFAWMPICFMQYSREERRFAILRFAVIVVVLVADLLFVSSSHAIMMLFKAYRAGEFGSPQDTNLRLLMELLWVSAFSQIYLPLLAKVWQIGLILFDTLAPLDDLQRHAMLYFATVMMDMHRYMYLREMLTIAEFGVVAAIVVVKDMLHDVYQFGIRSAPALQSCELMKIPLWHTCLGIGGKHWSNSRWLETAGCLLQPLANFLELPKRYATMFTWTIDAGYPHETETCDFYFAETKVQITNMPAKFDQAFKHWTAKGEKRQEALAELFQGTPFDVALAFDAMDKSTGEWGKVWDGFSDRFKLYQLLTIQLGGIMFCRFWPRITIKLASSVMILAAGVMIRLSSSKEVMNFVRDFSQPRSASTWILCIGMVVCDLLELCLVSFLQHSEKAIMDYRLRRFARLFQSRILLGILLSCHVCCNSDVYITFSEMKF